MTEVNISIIIRTFNEERYLERAIKSILKQELKGFEIIFVDSGSVDNTLKIIKKYMKLRSVPIKLIKIAAGNFTYGKAINMGIEAAANTEYAVILSAHAIPCDSGWLESLTSPLANTEIAGVYGKQTVLPEHNKHKIEKILMATAFKSLYKSYSYTSSRSCFFSNANSAIKIEHWKTNKFDENLPNAEDHLWAKNEIKRGFQIRYQSDAAVYHSHADSYRQHYIRMLKLNRAFYSINKKKYPRLRLLALARNIAAGIDNLVVNTIKNPRDYLYNLHFFCFTFINYVAMFAGRREKKNRRNALER